MKHKVIRAEIKAVDAERGTVDAIVSTEAKDRDGDVVRASGWDLDRFRRHPVLLSSHNYGSLMNQIGEWSGMRVEGKKLVGTAKYFVGEGNPEADWAFNLARHGRAAYSVGFLPDMDKAKRLEGEGFMGGYEFRGQELIEVSHVTVPSNPQALQRMKGIELDPAVAAIVSEVLQDTEEDVDPESSKALDDLMEKVWERIEERMPGFLDGWTKANEEPAETAAEITEAPEGEAETEPDWEALADALRDGVRQAVEIGG